LTPSCRRLDWLATAQKRKQQMNIGVVSVMLVGVVFIAYVFIGIKRGWIK
jgi:hypothetical protein